MADRAGGPLAGVRVLELGTMYAAPTCGRMLRDFGADVIKVEDPGTGDYARQWTPMKNGQSFGFARLNSGKRSVALDLRSDAEVFATVEAWEIEQGISPHDWEAIGRAERDR